MGMQVTEGDRSTYRLQFNFKRQVRPAISRRLQRSSDGTPVIDQMIRMLSVDAPRKDDLSGGARGSQAILDRCRLRLTNGFFDFLPASLRDHLISKINDSAASRYLAAAKGASSYFEDLLEERLQKSNGTLRRVAIVPAGAVVDRSGRLLAYLAPWFEGTRCDPLPSRDSQARRTFNLQMVDSGWAALFLVYPSLPRNAELEVVIDAAEKAWSMRSGQWQFGEDLLLAHEFRACLKLGQPIAVANQNGETRNYNTDDEFDADRASLDGWIVARRSAQSMASSAFKRHCIDVRTMTDVGPYDYWEIPPPFRLWARDDEIAHAWRALGLT